MLSAYIFMDLWIVQFCNLRFFSYLCFRGITLSSGFCSYEYHDSWRCWFGSAILVDCSQSTTKKTQFGFSAQPAFVLYIFLRRSLAFSISVLLWKRQKQTTDELRSLLIHESHTSQRRLRRRNNAVQIFQNIEFTADVKYGEMGTLLAGKESQ